MQPILPEQFESAKQLVLSRPLEPEGIGTLAEKTVHAVLKLSCAPDPALHEIPIAGSIADIFTGEEIIEIQTGGFHPLKKKLEKFLPLMPVTIVYPIPLHKWVIWIDPVTGEARQPHKSPKLGKPHEIFRQLVYLLPYLKDPHLRFHIVLLDLEEYRLLDGWSRDKKRGSHRHDRIPLSIQEQISIERIEDYMQFIPYELPAQFTRKDFQTAARLSPSVAQSAVSVLFHIGLLRRVGKSANAYLYEVSDD